jgi:RimJ/RimL family protein N-acetyltransferase
VAGESKNLTFGPGEFGISLKQERAVLQQIAEAPISLCLLGEIEDEIAGILTFNAERRLRLQHVGEFGMSVLRKYWNLGLSSHLLDALISWAAQTEVIRKINRRVEGC